MSGSAVAEAAPTSPTTGPSAPSGPRRVLTAVGVLLVVAAVSASATWLVVRDEAPGPSKATIATEPTHDRTPLEISYPQGWAPGTLSAADRSAGLVAKAQRRQPAASFLVRTVATSGGTVQPDALARSTSDALAAGIRGYQELRSQVLVVGAHEAVRLTYLQQDGSAGATYSVLTIVPLDGRAVYATVRTTAADADRLAPEIDALLLAAVEAATG